jgi:integrase
VREEQDQRDKEVGGHVVADPGVPVAGAESGTAGRRSLETFLEIRLAAEWYAGQPLCVGESVSQVINRFSPRSVPPAQWARIEGLVRDSVRHAVPVSAHSAEALMNVVTQLAVWVQTIGQPLTAEVVFHPDTVDRFAKEACAHLAAGTQNNYRSQLRGVGAAVLGPDVYPPAPLQLPKADPVAPYSVAEVAGFRSWARGLPTERYRDNVAVILAFALGAGLSSQEINRLVGTDVTVDDDGVTVQVIGERTRDVPVLAAYEDEVADLARRAEEGPVFLPGRRSIDRKQVPNFLFRCPKGPMGRPNVDRLRNTWIVGHLSAGTHLSALSEAAGVRPDQVVRYQRFAVAPAPEVARRQLRGA